MTSTVWKERDLIMIMMIITMMMIMVIVMIINSLEVGLGGGRSPRQGRQITLELRRPKLGANKSSFADVEKYLIDNV